LLKIPLSDIIDKIKKEKNLTDEEINKKIDEKLTQLSGLISKEGAAHIIANELGVKVFESFSGKLQIKNIVAGMRSVETVGKIQEISEIKEFQSKERKGKLAWIVIGDETGTIRVVMWGDQADNVKNLKQDTIVKIKDAYVKENNNAKELHLNERSQLIINPEGEKVGEVKQTLPARRSISDLKENDENVEILGTIVQVFDPRFFEICPECNKRARLRETAYICEKHGEVKPNYSYVLNVFLDDSTDNIRAVFFRNQAERLLETTHEEFIKYKDNPESFEDIKTKLLGEQIKLKGRINKNEMFDRLEFITQLVFPHPDPKEELERLEAIKQNDG
jgi:replication factor A1|tara:strand:+ start:1255 stop:2256 length:1002 start_codon:yes stop_codon:yes gene_type:complete